MDERYIDVSYDEDNGLRLTDAFKAIRRSFIVCLLAGVVAAGVFFAYTVLRMEPQYQSSFTVYVSNRPASVEIPKEESAYFLNIGDVQASLSLARTYAYVFESREIAMSAVQSTGLSDYEGRALSQSLVSTSVEQETPLVTATVTADSPKDAYKLSEAVLELIPDRTAMLPDGSSMTVVEPPQVPDGPSSPRKVLNAAIGFILGFGLAALVVVVRGDKDKLIKDKDELEDRFEVPAIVDAHDIFPLLPQRIVPIVGVMDAQDGNLAAADAISLAELCAAQRMRVLLIDGDNNNAACRNQLGVRKTTGLSEILSGDMAAFDAIQHVADKGIDFIASGEHAADFALKVRGTQMESLLVALEREYDCVIIAVPPVLSDNSALVLADRAKRAYLSVCAGRTEIPDVAATLRRLRLADVYIDGFLFSEPRSRVRRLIVRHG